MVGKYNTVAAEVVVGRSVAEIAAVVHNFIAVKVSAPDSLVGEVPDKAALIQRFFVSQISIFVHAAVAVAHGMSVFAHDERLVAVFTEEFLDVGNFCVHLAFHVARAVVFSVPENAFIMNETGRVSLAEVFGHVENVFAAVGLIAARPDDDAGMVLSRSSMDFALSMMMSCQAGLSFGTVLASSRTAPFTIQLPCVSMFVSSITYKP